MNQLPVQSSYERTFLNTTQTYFNKYPHNWQLPVGGCIISDICEKPETRQLCVQPTGSCKCLLFQTITKFIKGLTLCLSPLVSLTADQVNKLMVNTWVADTIINTLHLDECEQRDIPEIMALIKYLKLR